MTRVSLNSIFFGNSSSAVVCSKVDSLSNGIAFSGTHLKEGLGKSFATCLSFGL